MTGSAPPEILIRAQNLTKTYRSGDAELVIFDNLNLEVQQGERLALVGESGAGKSTLLHIAGRSGQAFEWYDILQVEGYIGSRGCGSG